MMDSQITEKTETQGTAKKDCRIKMLVMAFITFACVFVMPLFTLKDLGGINIYASDLTSFSTFAVGKDSLEEGSLVEIMQQMEDDTYEKAEMKAIFVEFARNFEPQVINFINNVRTAAIAVLGVLVAIIAGFGVMIYAGAKNKKRLYRIAAITLIVLFFAIPLTVSKFINIDPGSLISGGTSFGIIMLVLDCFLPFREKKEKKAKA